MSYNAKREPAWHRPRRIAELLIVLWIIGIGDLLLTLHALTSGFAKEANPVARSIHLISPVTGLIGFKLFCMLLSTLVLWKSRHARFCEVAVWMMTIVYFGVLCHWSNVTNLALAR